MVKSKFGRFIDNSFIFSVFLLISLSFVRTKLSNFLISLLISIVISTALIILIIKFENRHLTKLSILNSEKQAIIDYNIALRTMSESSQLTFFKNMLNCKNIKQNPNGLIIDNTLILCLKLHKDIINTEDIFILYSKIKNIKSYNLKEICIICNKVSNDAESLIKTINDITITIFLPIETYALMKKYSFFPKLKEKPPIIKTHIFKQEFLKNKGKTFLKCGMFLYLLSIILPYTSYYLITASILTLIGFIFLIFGKKQNKQQTLSKQILLLNSNK